MQVYEHIHACLSVYVPPCMRLSISVSAHISSQWCPQELQSLLNEDMKDARLARERANTSDPGPQTRADTQYADIQSILASYEGKALDSLLATHLTHITEGKGLHYTAPTHTHSAHTHPHTHMTEADWCSVQLTYTHTHTYTHTACTLRKDNKACTSV